MAQLPLLPKETSYARGDFVVSAANAQAAAAVEAWPAWPGRRLALVGPEGSGKTHLAAAWAQEVGAVTLSSPADLAALRGRPVLVEDADRGLPEEALFHLINMAEAEGGGLLLTARTRPSEWPTALPDLRSRLNALTVAELGEPDDALLEAVLRKVFLDHHVRPTEDVFPYLLRRIERSIPAARAVVEKIDAVALAQRREVSRALAREILEAEDLAV